MSSRACSSVVLRGSFNAPASLIFVELFDGCFVGNREHHLVAAFFGLADLPELRARRALASAS